MSIWKIVGYFILILKICIPLLLILFGMIDLGKAVVSSEEKAISKATSSLIRRFIAAIVVFFIPTLVSTIFNILNVIDISKGSDYNDCVQCVTNVSKENCPLEETSLIK